MTELRSNYFGLSWKPALPPFNRHISNNKFYIFTRVVVIFLGFLAESWFVI